MHVADPQLALTNDHLVQLSQALLALVPLELRPELQVLVNQLEGLSVVLGETDLLPELVRQVRPLNSLQIEVAVALVLEHCRVTRVGQGARVTVAHARQVVLVTTEGLSHGLRFKGAVAMVDHSPHHIILKHYI